MNGIGRIINLLRKETPSPGTDYTGTVTKVENGTAYVRLTGSEITDTPVALSIDAKPGDKVRVRVCNGRAWVTGNDTLPPSNDKKEVATKMSRDMGNRDKYIIIRDGIMKFIANTLCVDSKNFKLDENGNAEFSGMLKAAGGTFSGTLDAAGGSFAGNVQVAWKRGDDLRQQVVAIGVNSKDAPIQINWPVSNGGYTHVMGGKIRVGYTTTGAYCDLLPSGPQTSSDRRLKTDIVDMDAETALTLHPVKFRFIDDDIQHTGFIAQEVQEVFPDAVINGENGFLSLNYQELIAPILALVQQQEKSIAELETEIKALMDAIKEI